MAGKSSGLYFEQDVPSKVHRRDLTAKVRKRRICIDDRNYVPVQFTIPGDVAVGKYEPEWHVYREFYLARITATIGRHDSGTHPSDGTPGGQALKVNVRRILWNQADDSQIRSTDLSIDANNHLDDGAVPATEGEYDILDLTVGDALYIDVTQVGSTRPGRNLVVTAYLVPLRISTFI